MDPRYKGLIGVGHIYEDLLEKAGGNNVMQALFMASERIQELMQAVEDSEAVVDRLKASLARCEEQLDSRRRDLEAQRFLQDMRAATLPLSKFKAGDEVLIAGRRCLVEAVCSDHVRVLTLDDSKFHDLSFWVEALPADYFDKLREGKAD
jgi:hypothetical protein